MLFIVTFFMILQTALAGSLIPLSTFLIAMI